MNSLFLDLNTEWSAGCKVSFDGNFVSWLLLQKQYRHSTKAERNFFTVMFPSIKSIVNDELYVELSA